LGFGFGGLGGWVLGVGIVGRGFSVGRVYGCSPTSEEDRQGPSLHLKDRERDSERARERDVQPAAFSFLGMKALL